MNDLWLSLSFPPAARLRVFRALALALFPRSLNSKRIAGFWGNPAFPLGTFRGLFLPALRQPSAVVMVDARSTRLSHICAVALAHLEQPTLSALSPPPALLRKAKKLGVLLVLLVAAPVDGYTPPQRWTRPAGSSASRSSVRAQAQQTLPSTSGAQPSTSILVRPAMPNVPMPQRPNVPLAPSPADQRSPQGQPYWFDERIHSFGNIGLGGRFHAFCAPIATRVIDKLSYGGVNVRERVHASLPSDATILDLCCGVGCSTLPGATGVDTSPAMLDVARFWYPLANFETGNAESYGNAFSYDVVTVMFATHEMPREARQRVLANAMRIARRQVLVVDIDPQFKLALVNDASRRTQVAALNVPALGLPSTSRSAHRSHLCPRRQPPSWRASRTSWTTWPPWTATSRPPRAHAAGG